jgi:hypothetical protein
MLKKTLWLIINSPEYLYALVIVTFFSIGFWVTEYLKSGGYL